MTWLAAEVHYITCGSDRGLLFAGSVPENTTQATVPVPSQNSSFTIAAVLSPTRNAPPPANATVAAAPPPLIVNVISPARQAPPPSSGKAAQHGKPAKS